MSTVWIVAVRAKGAILRAPLTRAAGRPHRGGRTVTLPAHPATHPLLREWSGPYGGVPPWDKVSPELFTSAFTAAIDLRRREIAAIVGNPEAPTFANTIEALERAGRPLERVSVAVRRDDQQLQRARVPGPGSRVVADAVGRRRRDHLRRGALRAPRGGACDRATAGLTPEQRRLTERTCDAFVRRARGSDAAEKQELSRINQELATAFSDFATKVLADENTWIVLDQRGRPRPDCRPRSSRPARPPPTSASSTGKWAVVNTRSRVDPFLTFSSRRDLREQVWRTFKKPRRQRRRQRHQRDLIAQIVQLRAERATLLGFATHAHWRMDDTMARDPQQAARPDDARVAAGGRARPRGSRRHAGDRRRATARRSPSSRGTTSTTPRRSARRSTTSITNELKPYFELNNMIAASFCMAEQLLRPDASRRSPARCRSSTPTCASGRSRTRRRASTSACSTATTSRAPASARARGRRSYRGQRPARTARSRRSRRTTTTSSRARPASRC